MGQEELLEKEPPGNDLEEDDPVESGTEEYFAEGLDSGTESDTIGDSSGEIYTPAKCSSQGKQIISVNRQLSVETQVHPRGQPEQGRLAQAPQAQLRREHQVPTSDQDLDEIQVLLGRRQELQNPQPEQVKYS